MAVDIGFLLEQKIQPRKNYPKSFAFSVHKAGSSLMNGLLHQYCRAIGFPIIDIPGTLFHKGIFEKDWHTYTAMGEVIVDGYLYLGFRALPEILNPDHPSAVINPRDYRSCLLVRDPRDCLVSQYFSWGGGGKSSHALPSEQPQKFRELYQSQETHDIDSYTVAASHGLHQKLSAYLAVAQDNPNVKLFKYEDIYFDKLKFLTDMLEWLEIPIESEKVLRVAKKNDVRPLKEDLRNHIRKGTPGDYLEKLSESTSRQITNHFRDLMENFGYAL